MSPDIVADHTQEKFAPACVLEQVGARFSHHNRYPFGEILVEARIASHAARESAGIRRLTLFLNADTERFSHYPLLPSENGNTRTFTRR